MHDIKGILLPHKNYSSYILYVSYICVLQWGQRTISTCEVIPICI